MILLWIRQPKRARLAVSRERRQRGVAPGEERFAPHPAWHWTSWLATIGMISLRLLYWLLTPWLQRGRRGNGAEPWGELAHGMLDSLLCQVVWLAVLGRQVDWAIAPPGEMR